VSEVTVIDQYADVDNEPGGMPDVPCPAAARPAGEGRRTMTDYTDYDEEHPVQGAEGGPDSPLWRLFQAEQRLATAERERDDARFRVQLRQHALEASVANDDALRQRAEVAEAGAAAMREVLLSIASNAHVMTTIYDTLGPPYYGIGIALAAGAGAAMLARLKRLEAAAGIVREWQSVCNCQRGEHCKHCVEIHLAAIEAALAERGEG
jgi:hypothetical protein